MELLDSLIVGFQTALQPNILMYCFIGVFLGTFVGVLPGIGPLAAISLLLPITYHIEPTAAIVMLAGVYYGAEYGGSTASILLNLPGTAAAAVTCLDGYPMAQSGRAGVALFMVTIASLAGGIAGVTAMILFSPAIVEIGLSFGPAEYFSLMVLGLVAASTLASGSPAKGLAMVVFGLLLGTVGTDINSGIARFDFDIPEMMDGISLVALAMGLFGISEIVKSISVSRGSKIKEKITFKSMLPTKKDLKVSAGPIARGGVLGGFFGALPGTGASIAAFVAYAVEKKVAKDPTIFGKGAVQGVTAPESANNAAAQAAFIPTMTLGIPGSATMALMLGALIIHGIQPGPMLMVEQPDLFWGLIISFLIGNVMLVVLNIPLIGMWVSLLNIPYRLLYPTILVFIMMGVYSVNNNTFDIYMIAVIGVIGYFLMVLNFEGAPLLLGFILGPLMEENMRRALLLSRGDMATFIDRPISMWILVITAVILLWSFFSAAKVFLRAKTLEHEREEAKELS
ncbi:tripartite tricarboxylate transporter permease [Orrella sp. 11846]|uniref:tripartite tricarboxylate transporter permease n=1 Tax=Orrella sp. 11846 TaxID=3409913 RepID=UPI003B59F58A